MSALAQEIQVAQSLYREKVYYVQPSRNLKTTIPGPLKSTHDFGAVFANSANIVVCHFPVSASRRCLNCFEV